MGSVSAISPVRGGAFDGLPAQRVRADVEPDPTLIAPDGCNKGPWVVPIAIARYHQLSGHGSFGDRVAVDSVAAPAQLVGTTGIVGDPRDPLERLQRRVTGEDALRHHREPIVCHRHAGFKEGLQSKKRFKISGELALDGKGRGRDPTVEMHLCPVAFDRRSKVMDGKSDDRSGEKDKEQQLSRYARETNGKYPIWR